MLTREDDNDVHALRRQGWTISTIARATAVELDRLDVHFLAGLVGLVPTVLELGELAGGVTDRPAWEDLEAPPTAQQTRCSVGVFQV